MKKYLNKLKGVQMKKFGYLLMIAGTGLLAACATVSERPVAVEAPVPQKQLQQAQIEAQQPAAKRYKRKVAIARFTNESNYGRTLMTDQDYDRIGKQASDMLASKLIKSNNFVVFERTDLGKVQKEQIIAGEAGLIGVDALIIGSVTEFGRSITGKSGFLSSTKVQTARAKVDVRIVDVKTGQAFFSATGAGDASTESGEIAGFGSSAEYDATLNDRAISAAISDMIDKLVSSLEERSWKTDVLQVQGGQVFISGGSRQGLKIGDTLQIMKKGKAVKSQQSGFDINLPPQKVAVIRVSGFFGDSENNEGSVCEIVSGTVDPASLKTIYVEGAKQ
jgi:curli biogenesis system outer membrane secretion channel CsgG